MTVQDAEIFIRIIAEIVIIFGFGAWGFRGRGA
jgi:hypothetical protein